MPKKKDATKLGASEVVLSRRHADALEAIAEKVAKRQSGEEETPEKPPEDLSEQSAIAPEVPDQGIDEPQPEPEEKPEEPEEEFETLVVDGQEVKKTRAEIEDAGRRALQKTLAADKRLQEASELKKELQAMKEQFAALTKVLTEPEPEEEKKPEPPKIEDLKAAMNKALADYRYSLQYKEEDEQAKAEALYLSAQDEYYAAKFGGNKETQQPTLDKEGLLNDLTFRLTQKAIYDKFTTKPVEQGGYKDLWDDLTARELVQARVDVLLKQGKSGIDYATYQEAGDFVRKILGWDLTHKDASHRVTVENPPQTTVANPENFKGRVEVKRKIDNLESVNAKTTTAKEEKPPSKAEIIAEMRAIRPGTRVT